MKKEYDNAVILCVDDEPLILNSLRSLFAEQLKLVRHIEIAESAEEALQVVKELEEDGLDLQVVIADYIMPDIKGDEFLTQLHAIRPHTKKIMLTGQSDISGVKRAINQAELYRFMDKPWNNEDMLLTVQSAITSYRQTQEIQQHNQQLKMLNEALEQKVKKRTLELEQKNQALLLMNEEKNELLGIAAHDLKNPLAGIVGMVQIIEMGLETENKISEEELLEYIGDIKQSADKMLDLITNLLDVNKIESGKFILELDFINITALILDLVKSYSYRANSKNIKLHFERMEPYMAFVDKNYTHQILDNLISNAIKYSPQNKNVYLRLIQKSDSLCFEIQDEGPGLTPEEQTRLFSKFTRFGPQPTGDESSTGLGLFIVKKLADAMNTTIDCHSEPQKGSTFVVKFPLN